MINYGATHNFLSEKIADKLHIPRAETSNYGVVIGNGSTLRGKGVCKGVTITLQELTIQDDFLPLDLGGVDVILGMQWLKKMGYMKVDWGALTMTFQAGGNQVTIKGDLTLNKAEISFKMLTQVWQEEDQGYLVELRALEPRGTERDFETEGMKSPEVVHILQKYSSVFELPTGMPPNCTVDHQIILNNGQAVGTYDTCTVEIKDLKH